MAFQQFPQKGGIPSGNTAGRPSSPAIGDTYYNGQLEILEIWNGTSWVAVSAPPSTPQITSVTDASTGDAYTSTAGKLAVVFAAGIGGGTPSQYNAFTVSGGHSASSSSTTVTLTGLTPGTSYEVYGNGQNNFGTTVNTPNQAAVTPTTLPQVPTIGTATTSGITTDVTVSWTNGATGGKNLSSITITPFLNGTTAQTSQTASTTSSTSHTFTGLTQGSSYTFKVKATNANGTCADSNATNSITIPTFFTTDYLVVAGGGGGGGAAASAGSGAGGGAGGYRSFTSQSLVSGTNYSVTVGGGGAGGASGFNNGTKGSDSVFNTNTSTGGGYGGSGRSGAGVGAGQAGGTGGSGGGGGFSDSGYPVGAGAAGNTPSTSPSQGNAGGGGNNGAPYGGGGGGGASATGSGSTNTGNPGGAGTANSITGTSVTYAGGGGGGAEGSAPAGGAGGGGDGGNRANGSAGTANRGGGGGGAGGSSGTSGGSGGSGVVIIRYPDTRTITIGAGLTGSTATDGSFKVTTITAGSGNVSWA